MATRLLFVGGFLGAGKTTLLMRAAHALTARGYRVGIVTNDQAAHLVDTALVRAAGIAVQEVAGGCFCCRFPDLLASITHLQESVNPDVILGEPVGSCTDLISTIFRPLHASYPTRFQVAPLTVLLDPLRDPAVFPDEVGYIYGRQLAEAHLIAVSKSDLYESTVLDQQVQALRERYPTTPVLSLSATTGAGLSAWLEICLRQSGTCERLLEMDYSIYARGEAHLGWLNASGIVSAPRPFSLRQWAAGFLNEMEHACATMHTAVAHIKLHLSTSTGGYRVSLTRLGQPACWDLLPDDTPTARATFLLNARVSTTPLVLETLVRPSLARAGTLADLHTDISDLACFSPLPPRPTYRLLQIQ